MFQYSVSFVPSYCTFWLKYHVTVMENYSQLVSICHFRFYIYLWLNIRVSNNNNNNKRKSKTLSTMPLHGRYWSRLEENHLDKELTFMWLKSRTLKPSTEGMIMAAQDQSLKTKNYQYAIMKSIAWTDANCRLCKGSLETIDHIVSACPVLARTSYIERHNRIVKYSETSLRRTLIRQTFALEELVFIALLDKSLSIHWV